MKCSISTCENEATTKNIETDEVFCDDCVGRRAPAGKYGPIGG